MMRIHRAVSYTWHLPKQEMFESMCTVLYAQPLKLS